MTSQAKLRRRMARKLQKSTARKSLLGKHERSMMEALERVRGAAHRVCSAGAALAVASDAAGGLHVRVHPAVPRLALAGGARQRVRAGAC